MRKNVFTTISLRQLLDERAILMATLALAAAVSWMYLIQMAAVASTMPPADHFRPVAMLLMWTVMMIGMMLPTALPGIQVFATAEQRRWGKLSAVPYCVAIGYLLAWILFSALATGGQWLLHEMALLSVGSAINNPAFAGAVVLMAGLFQITPMKNACLRYCRNPMGILAKGFPNAPPAALATGVRMGLYCIGCCWALMLLMFVGGVMSLFWMALLTVIILLEKVVAAGRQLSLGIGIALVVYGGWLIGSTVG